MFAMEVTEELDTWPEQENHDRKWVRILLYFQELKQIVHLTLVQNRIMLYCANASSSWAAAGHKRSISSLSI